MSLRRCGTKCAVSPSTDTRHRAGPDADAQPFPNPADYLSATELAAYQRWTEWSVKPAGLDYLQPRPEYFR